MPLASNQLSLTQASALYSPWITCYDGTTTFSIYDNAAGTPNGVVTAERGSYLHRSKHGHSLHEDY